MIFDSKLDKLIATIFPLWKKEFETFIFEKYDDNKELFLDKLNVVLKHVDKPNWSGVGLVNQIREKKKQMLDSLEKRLMEPSVIKFYKSEIGDYKKFTATESEMIKECLKLKHLSSSDKDSIKWYIKELENMDSPYKLIKFKFELNDIIPYEIRSMYFRDYSEKDSIGQKVIIHSSPLISVSRNIKPKTDNIINLISEHSWKDILELYQDLGVLQEISDIMRARLCWYFRWTKGLLNSWNTYLRLGIFLSSLYLIHALSFKNVIIVALWISLVLVLNKRFWKDK